MSDSDVNLHQVLKLMHDQGASDLHIAMGTPPLVRTDGRLRALQMPALTASECQRLCCSVLSDTQHAALEQRSQVCVAFGVEGLSRFRASLFMQRGAVSGVLRSVPFRPLSLEELGLPAKLEQLVSGTRGLVLVGGPPGSGKSTTLSALIDKVNSSRRAHIATLEDPTEQFHAHKRSLISQLQLGTDAPDWQAAVRGLKALDVDVVLLGRCESAQEVVDALELAEGGRLVLAPLDTCGASASLRRILERFPDTQQVAMRGRLARLVRGVVSQLLVPRASGSGRALTLEVLRPTQACRALIAEGKLSQVHAQLQRDGATVNQALYMQCARRQVLVEEALGCSPDPEELSALIDAARRQG